MRPCTRKSILKILALSIVVISLSLSGLVLAKTPAPISAKHQTSVSSEAKPLIAWSPDNTMIAISDPKPGAPLHGVKILEIATGKVTIAAKDGALASWIDDNTLRFIDAKGPQRLELDQDSSTPIPKKESDRLDFPALVTSQCLQHVGAARVFTQGDETLIKLLDQIYQLDGRYRPWFGGEAGNYYDGPVTPPCLASNGKYAALLTLSNGDPRLGLLETLTLPKELWVQTKAPKKRTPKEIEEERMLGLFFGDKIPDVANLSVETLPAEDGMTWVIVQALNTTRKDFAWFALVSSVKLTGDDVCAKRTNTPSANFCKDGVETLIKAKKDLLLGAGNISQSDQFHLLPSPELLKDKAFTTVTLQRAVSYYSRESDGGDASKKYTLYGFLKKRGARALVEGFSFTNSSSNRESSNYSSTVTITARPDHSDGLLVRRIDEEMPNDIGGEIYTVTETTMLKKGDLLIQEDPPSPAGVSFGKLEEKPSMTGYIFNEQPVDKALKAPHKTIKGLSLMMCLSTCYHAESFKCTALDFQNKGGKCELFKQPFPEFSEHYDNIEFSDYKTYLVPDPYSQ